MIEGKIRIDTHGKLYPHEWNIYLNGQEISGNVNRISFSASAEESFVFVTLTLLMPIEFDGEFPARIEMKELQEPA